MIFFFWISKIIDVDKSHRLDPNSARNCCPSVNRALRSAAEEVAIFVPVFVLNTPSWMLGVRLHERGRSVWCSLRWGGNATASSPEPPGSRSPLNIQRSCSTRLVRWDSPIHSCAAVVVVHYMRRLSVNMLLTCLLL